MTSSNVPETPKNAKNNNKKILRDNGCVHNTSCWEYPLNGNKKNRIKIKIEKKNETTTLTQFPIKDFLTPLRYKTSLRAHLTSD